MESSNTAALVDHEAEAVRVDVGATAPLTEAAEGEREVCTVGTVHAEKLAHDGCASLPSSGDEGEALVMNEEHLQQPDERRSPPSSSPTSASQRESHSRLVHYDVVSGSAVCSDSRVIGRYRTMCKLSPRLNVRHTAPCWPSSTARRAQRVTDG